MSDRKDNPLSGSFSSGVRLPQIQGNERKIIGARSSRADLVPFTTKTSTLKLPELGIPKKRIGETTFSARSFRENVNSSISSGRLTKQEAYNNEVSKTLLNNKESARLSMDIDKKISRVSQSFAQFERKNRLVNESMQDAVRRSAADSIHNRKLTSSPLFMEGDTSGSFEKYLEVLEGVDESDASQRNFDTHASHKYNESSSDSDSSASFAENETTRRHKRKTSTTQKHDQEDRDHENENSPRSLSPIMTNLTDKAFLTKLKKREGQAERNVNEISNRLNSIQQKIDNDRRKDQVEETKSKPLYKPRNDNQPYSDKGPTEELVDFLQSTGGKTGSWKPDDHFKFLKAYGKWSHVPGKVIDITKKETKTKSAKEIMEHIKWYEQYEALTRVNKDELRKWDLQKRPNREMLYKMASEGRRNKLENEKRRQEHLKAKRLEERLRGREILSEYKKSKSREEDALKIKAAGDYNMDDMQKEMLELADKIQSMNGPNSQKLKPPRRRPYSTANSATTKKYTSDAIRTELKEHLNMSSKEKQSNDSSIKLPPIDESNNNYQSQLFAKMQSYKEHSQSAIGESRDGELIEPKLVSGRYLQKGIDGQIEIPDDLIVMDLIASKDNALSSKQPTKSKLTEETFSHKLRKEAQKCKRMEVLSQSGRTPNRVEESRLWDTSNSLSIRGRKGVPTWRKA